MLCGDRRREFKEKRETSLAAAATAALIFIEYFPRAQQTALMTFNVYIDPPRVSEELQSPWRPTEVKSIYLRSGGPDRQMQVCLPPELCPQSPGRLAGDLSWEQREPQGDVKGAHDNLSRVLSDLNPLGMA